MSAIRALEAAHAAGLAVRIEGQNLRLEAIAEPPRAVLDALRSYKTDILDLLRRTHGGWTVYEWQTYFDERAGIAEFERSYTRYDAELVAFEDCVDLLLAQDLFEGRAPGACIHCGKAASADSTAVLDVVSSNGTGLLHTACAPKWKILRRVKARTSLSFLLPRIGGPSHR